MLPVVPGSQERLNQGRQKVTTNLILNPSLGSGKYSSSPKDSHTVTFREKYSFKGICLVWVQNESPLKCVSVACGLFQAKGNRDPTGSEKLLPRLLLSRGICFRDVAH